MVAGPSDSARTKPAAISPIRVSGSRTVDLSGLRFADSSVIRALVLAGRTLKDRGGGLELARPQPVVARALSLLGVDQAIEILGGTGTRADPERSAATGVGGVAIAIYFSPSR